MCNRKHHIFLCLSCLHPSLYISPRTDKFIHRSHTRTQSHSHRGRCNRWTNKSLSIMPNSILWCIRQIRYHLYYYRCESISSWQNLILVQRHTIELISIVFSLQTISYWWESFGICARVLPSIVLTILKGCVILPFVIVLPWMFQSVRIITCFFPYLRSGHR